uniref:Uncharacterized protein n=1 Tax=Cacopsylla melanoneura TaxID=428564 RepID=A0A8D8WSR2_9HEMI
MLSFSRYVIFLGKTQLFLRVFFILGWYFVFYFIFQVLLHFICIYFRPVIIIYYIFYFLFDFFLYITQYDVIMFFYNLFDFVILPFFLQFRFGRICCFYLKLLCILTTFFCNIYFTFTWIFAF